MSDADDLVAATRTFLARHADALDGTNPKRALEACQGLHDGICSTLANEAARIQRESGAATGGDDPSTDAFAAGLLGAASGDRAQRAALAYASLRKRVAEAEGILMHLRLTLSKGSADGPAFARFAKRVDIETGAAKRALGALLSSVLSWKAALDGVVEARDIEARDALRIARECLVMGAPDAARTLIAGALERTRKNAPPGVRASQRAVDATAQVLAQQTTDVVVLWRCLDLTERYANAVAMTPPSA